ncbi:MAG: Na+/H+ antiporter subunit B [Bacteroidota bacterium]|jgi:multicomponent Na+:H+ antiporter subunit B|nr:Na+/H+ antiporter subunit B [Bacteroidota bacterium]
MSSVILRIAVGTLTPLLLLVSLMLLLRGHNAPGGGFIAGLLAALAIVLYAMARGTARARRLLRITPRRVMAGGLLIALASGATALFREQPLLTGVWAQPRLPVIGVFPIGTPLLFDVGVFCVVLGFVLTMFFALVEAEEEHD